MNLPELVITSEACLTQMSQAYAGGHMVVAMTVLEQDAPRYGIFRLLSAPSGRSVAVSSMVEKPNAGTEPLAAGGRYILDQALFSTLSGIARGTGGKIQLTDAITVDAARLTLTAFRFSSQRFDCGRHDGLVEADLARQHEVKRQCIGALFGMDASKRQVRINDTPPSARRLDGRATALEGRTT